MTGALAGCRAVVCRSVEQSGPLVSRLQGQGAATVLLPLIRVEAPTDGGAALALAVDGVSRYAWVVFTSANAVQAVAGVLGGRRWPGEVRVAVVGPATAAAAAAAGIPVQLTGPGATGRDLATVFPPPTPPGTVLVPAAEVARPELQTGLRAAGWSVDVVPAYRTTTPDVAPSQLDALEGADAVLFTAPSTVERFLAVAGPDRLPAIVVAIGPTTAARAAALSVQVTAVARPSTDAGLVDALERCWPVSAGPRRTPVPSQP